MLQFYWRCSSDMHVYGVRLLSVRLGFSTSSSWFGRMQLIFVLLTSSLCSHPSKSRGPVRDWSWRRGSLWLGLRSRRGSILSGGLQAHGGARSLSSSPPTLRVLPPVWPHQESKENSSLLLPQPVQSSGTLSSSHLWVSVHPVSGAAAARSRSRVGEAETTNSTTSFRA